MGVLTSGRSRSCDTKSGGVDALYVTPVNNIDALTYDGTTGEITGMVMVASNVFYEIETAEESLQFIEALKMENGSIVVDQSIDFTFRYRDQADRNFIMELAKCACGLAVIHTETTGESWLWGIIKDKKKNRGYVKLASADGDSGKAFGDANQEVLKLSAQSSEKARVITAAIPL